MHADHFELLKSKLLKEVVLHLPPLLPNTKPADQNATKNLSRSFSAWALSNQLGIPIADAAKAVVDDFNDGGIDAIYYEIATRVLYLVQGKLKNSEDFALAEAQKLIAGVRDLVFQRYDRFNKHVQDRRADIEHALEECKEIRILIAFTGNQLSMHADNEIKTFLLQKDEIDERLAVVADVYEPQKATDDLLASQAMKRVEARLTIHGCQKIQVPRICYYGQVAMTDLVDLFVKEGNSLFERNIRHFLGLTTGVNQSIQMSLRDRCSEFFYMSNGVTAIAEVIEPAGNVAGSVGSKKLKVEGLSVINGAQSIASAAAFRRASPDKPIDEARVLLTVIEVPPEHVSFAVDVTKARNHQNPVALGHFAALDPVHERLRRELSLEGVEYLYRPEASAALVGRPIIRLTDAAIALAIFHPNPNFPIIVRSEPSRFTNKDSAEYKQLFSDTLMGRRLANATRLYLCAKAIIEANEASSATGTTERLFYRHGWAAILWVAFQKNENMIPTDRVMTGADAAAVLSRPLDEWRQKVWDAARPAMASASKGPLAFFRNLTDARPFLIRLKNTSTEGTL
jgi:hypothetical protein